MIDDLIFAEDLLSWKPLGIYGFLSLGMVSRFIGEHLLVDLVEFVHSGGQLFVRLLLMIKEGILKVEVYPSSSDCIVEFIFKTLCSAIDPNRLNGIHVIHLVLRFMHGLIHPSNVVNVLLRVNFLLDFFDLLGQKISQVFLMLLGLILAWIQACVLRVYTLALLSCVKHILWYLMIIVKVRHQSGWGVFHKETLFLLMLDMIILIEHLPQTFQSGLEVHSGSRRTEHGVFLWNLPKEAVLFFVFLILKGWLLIPLVVLLQEIHLFKVVLDWSFILFIDLLLLNKQSLVPLLFLLHVFEVLVAIFVRNLVLIKNARFVVFVSEKFFEDK